MYTDHKKKVMSVIINYYYSNQIKMLGLIIAVKTYFAYYVSHQKF